MDEQFAEICRKTSIKAYLESRGVEFQRSGKHMKCKCPIPGHEGDHDPSFYVTTMPDGVELFKCFGCHNGGSVFTLIHLVENVRKGEVVKRLAAQAGVTLSGLEGARVEPLPQEVMEVFCREDDVADDVAEHVVGMLEGKATPDAVSRIASLYLKMDDICDLGDSEGVSRIRDGIAAVTAAYCKGGKDGKK